MTRARLSFSRQLIESLLTGAAVAAAMLSWAGLTTSVADYVAPLAVSGIGIALVGAVSRAALLPGWLTLLAQVALGGLLLQHTAIGAWAPTPANFHLFAAAWQQALGSAQQYAAPVPNSAPSVAVLFVAVGTVALVAADFVAQTLRRPALIALGLLALYTLPTGLLLEPPGVLSFALAASAFLALLFSHSDDALESWTRRDTQQQAEVREGTWSAAAIGVGACSVVLAVVAAALLPSPTWSFLPGRGPGGSGDGVSVVNPMLDLRRDLSRGQDRPMLYVTSAQAPSYLRIAALTLYSSGGWSAGNRQIPRSQTATGEALPPPAGVTAQLRLRPEPQAFRATDDFRSTWLPLAAFNAEVSAVGDWRYDRDTMDFIAVEDGLTTAGKQWSSTALLPQYTPRLLDRADPAAPQMPRRFLALPANLPPIVATLANEVAGQEQTDFRKARALQEWFRQEFRYDLSVADSLGSSDRDLQAFLEPEGRVGYCEQFAAAMALMARSLDIPARVAVGFLEPQQISDSEWEFSSHDLHAWPELYLPGSGWVRFEPTPGQRSGRAPDYTTGRLTATTASPSPTPSPTAVPTPTRRPTLQPRPEVTTPRATVRSNSHWAVVLGWTTLIVLTLLALLMVPRVVRGVRRARRARGSVEDSWRELEDTAIDWGLRFPQGLSPQQTGAAVHEQTPGGDGSGVATLVEQLERSRYAPAAVTPVDLGLEQLARADRIEALASLESTWSENAPTRRRLRARWLPRSVFVRRR